MQEYCGQQQHGESNPSPKVESVTSVHNGVTVLATAKEATLLFPGAASFPEQITHTTTRKDNKNSIRRNEKARGTEK